MESFVEIEKWLPIKGFDGLYEISNHGNVKTFHNGNKTKNAGIKIPGLSTPGYYQVQLTRTDKTRSCLFIHRLVGIHFIPNPDNKLKINHKDGNKLNNHYSNLEWCTQLENIQHAQKSGLMRKSKIPFRELIYMRELGLSLKFIAEWFGISDVYVSRLYIRHTGHKSNIRVNG